MNRWQAAAMLVGLSAVLPTLVQTQGRSSGRPEPTLTRLADAAQQGQHENDKTLRWIGHFMKGSEGQTYVPYTLRIEASPGAFEAVSVYVRVAEGAVYDAERRHNIYGNKAAPLPAGAQVATTTEPTVLGNVGASLAGARRVFEDAFRIDTSRAADSRVLRGAMTLRPGLYDVYIAVADRTRGSDASNVIAREHSYRWRKIVAQNDLLRTMSEGMWKRGVHRILPSAGCVCWGISNCHAPARLSA